MNRRRLLCQAGSAATLALAGCSVLGGDGDDEATSTKPLEVSELDYHGADDGSLVVTVVVSNTAAERVSATVYVDLTVDDSTSTRVRSVDVEAAGSTELTAAFEDVPKERFDDGGTLSVRWDYENG